jgi:hypothetical protein
VITPQLDDLVAEGASPLVVGHERLAQPDRLGQRRKGDTPGKVCCVHCLGRRLARSEEGVYQGRYIARDQGEYKVTFRIRYAADGATAESHARFGVREAWTEFTRSWQNQPLLKELAAQTDGKYYDEASAGTMAEDIRKRLALAVASQGQVRDHSLWDMPLAFGLLLVLVLAEWSLRRRSGLP